VGVSVRSRVGEVLTPRRDSAQTSQDADNEAGAKAESAALIAGVLPASLAEGRPIEEVKQLLEAAVEAKSKLNADDLKFVVAQGAVMHQNIDTIGNKVITVVGLVVAGGLEVAVALLGSRSRDLD